ncbi:HAMP domain-containing histidine kinase [Niabella sp. CC-SYL272]|uniref:sensor histidine kinase n=1 Tax=Niabella agricola TaxID=2891571 RepID=UPI001F228F65|nr:HAMP domain-containing sensor histidine kinase [Niabella agricola]MCF3112044.1 HAMP domain-containing histidine kinase [Niabella agricola]
MRLYTKLTLFAVATTIVVLGLFVWQLPFLMQKIASGNTNKNLAQQREKVLNAIRENGIGYYFQGDSAYGSYSMLKDEYISLESYYSGADLTRLQTAERIIDGDTINYRILIDTFTIQAHTYLLEIGKKITSIQEESVALQRATIGVLIVLTLIMALVQLFYTRHLLKPLGSIIRNRLIKKTFPFPDSQPPLLTSTYDFRYLDQSISQLMQQVNHAFEKEKEFTSNASHELMTPISIMQSKIENMLTDPELPAGVVLKLEDTMRIMKRLKKIVNALLLISRIENEQYNRNDTVIAKPMIREVLEELQHRADEKTLVVEERLTDGVQLHHVNRDLLFQLFYNLIHNAIRYNRPNGRITLSDRYVNGEYVLCIEDTGIGIEEPQHERIFDRFKKSTAQREGFGLGLSIVKSIADYQRIRISLNSDAGRGSQFELHFSAAHLAP